MNIQRIQLNNKSLLQLVFCTLIFLLSCGKDTVGPVDCTGVTPTYTTGVRTILDASCAKSGCHDAITQEQGMDFSSYDNAKVASQNGRFVGAIQHKGGFIAMPQNAAKLSDDKIQQLTCWVENGSPE
jgi:cytochrome c553